jgi:DNA-binding transcriptional ArsR family regulator
VTVLAAGALDLHVPWREAPEALRMRHVGREREIEAVVSGARQHARGGRPLPVYLFGAPGAGKSHVLAVARDAIEAELDLGFGLLADDTPEQRSAEALVLRIDETLAAPRWRRWREPPPAERDPSEPPPDATRRRVVVVEGLDRQLRALGVDGRRDLRRLLDARRDLWIVGSGATLPLELTAKDEAFYGAFDPWPIEPLVDRAAAALLDRLQPGAAHRRWPAQRSIFVLVAGGLPRTLAALGQAGRPGRPAADALEETVRRLTPAFQLRFRALAPQAQQLVELLAVAPRELGPSDLAARLGTSASQMSVQAGRLEDDGLIRRRSEGRQTWYRIVDAVFRHWLEQGGARWSSTRAACTVGMLEGLLAGPPAAAIGQRGFPSCPNPAMTLPTDAAAALAAAASEAVERARGVDLGLVLAAVVSWGGALAAAPPAAFDRFGSALQVASLRRAPMVALRATDAGLLVLASRAPARIDTVIAAGVLGDRAARAAVVATQLGERSEGPLHPELGRLWRLLAAEGASPGSEASGYPEG